MRHERLTSLLKKFGTEDELINSGDLNLVDEYLLGKRIVSADYCERPYSNRLRLDSIYAKNFEEKSNQSFQYFDDNHIFSIHLDLSMLNSTH